MHGFQWIITITNNNNSNDSYIGIRQYSDGKTAFAFDLINQYKYTIRINGEDRSGEQEGSTGYWGTKYINNPAVFKKDADIVGTNYSSNKVSWSDDKLDIEFEIDEPKAINLYQQWI